jgi:hypothetical protein
MDNQSVYPDPIPTKVEMKAAVDKFRNSLQETKKVGGHVNVAEKNKARKELEPLLVRLALYVMMKANGDLVKLSESGFIMNKSSVDPGYIPVVGNVTLGNGKNSGEMTASIKAIKAARAYGFCITDELPTENTQWKVTSVGTSKFLFQNLIPGKQHSVKVSVAGSRGQLVYSNIATMFVQ